MLLGRYADMTPSEVLDLADGSTSELAPDWDRWASGFRWVPDGSAVLCVADEEGARPIE